MSSLSDADQLLLKNNPDLSSSDIQKYNIKKARLFKLTIAICAIYGTLTLVVLLLTLFSAKGNQIFTEEIRPFTLTFVGGMIFVIILLIIQIVSFTPKALTTSVYDRDICPDFWKLVPTPTTDPYYTNASSNIKSLFQYQCVPDITLYNMYYQSSNSTVNGTTNYFNPYKHQFDTNWVTNSNLYVKATTADLKSLAVQKLIGSDGTSGYMSQFNTYTTIPSSNLQCNKIFPNYLANRNITDSDLKQTPYALACAYANVCGIPWTGQCGN